MKKEEKWTPHIIAVMAFVVFIVLGLACASTQKASNEKPIGNLKDYYERGSITRLVIFMHNSNKVLYNSGTWCGVFSTLDGKILPSSLSGSPYGGTEFPEENCIILYYARNISKYNTESIIYNERLESVFVESNKNIVPPICHASKSSAFRQRTVIVDTNGTAKFVERKDDEERNKVYFVDFASMEITFITVDDGYDEEIYGYDDRSGRIILSKEEGKFDVLSTETGEVLFGINLPRIILSRNSIWVVINNSDGFPKFDSFNFSGVSNPQFSCYGTQIISIVGHRITSTAEEQRNVQLISEYERRMESWKNSVKLYNDNYLAYLITNNFFYYQDRIPLNNPYGSLSDFGVPARANQRSYMLYQPPPSPKLELLGRQVYLLKVLNAENGNLMREVVIPYEPSTENISSYFFNDETGSYVMLNIPDSIETIKGRSYYDIGVFDIGKGEQIFTIPAEEEINPRDVQKRIITYDHKNKCLLAVSNDGTIKRWNIGGS